MFKNAFLSEFSLSDGEDVDSILKSHLLSNERLVIPAATINKTPLGEVLSSNMAVLGDGAISIAYGSDCKEGGLRAYRNKYPSVNWGGNIIELFDHFDNNELCSVYETKNTIKQFNKLMRDCASGSIPKFTNLFNKNGLSKSILDYHGEFDLNQYFTLIQNNAPNNKGIEQLQAHAKYFYNYFGSFSTDAGNTFSLENTVGFDYISQGYDDSDEKLTGLKILISSALDLTDGIEDFNFLSKFDGDFLNRLSYGDIFELRENWLHQTILDDYDKIIQECAQSYMKMDEGEIDNAIAHIEKAFELRLAILDSVKVELKSEVSAYKMHRLSRFLADTSIKFISYLSGAELARTVAQSLVSATTEVAVLVNKETQLKHLLNSKVTKIKDVSLKADTVLGGKSPVLEFLRLVSHRLE